VAPNAVNDFGAGEDNSLPGREKKPDSFRL
jgi:hypothetical protein